MVLQARPCARSHLPQEREEVRQIEPRDMLGHRIVAAQVADADSGVLAAAATKRTPWARRFWSERTMPPDTAPLFCDRCSKALRRGEGNFYIIKIDAVADPSPPVIIDPNIPEDLPGEIDRLLKQVSTMTEQELMDQVHRRVVLYLCTPCYRVWIEEPV